MPNFSETPEQTADRCLREVRASMRRAGLQTLYYAKEVDDRALSVAARMPKPTADSGADLPKELHKARESMRVAYRAVMNMRAEDAGREVWPSDVVEWLEQKTDRPHSIDTVNHALRDLRVLRLAWAPDERGWRLGSEQNALPTGDRQSERPTTSESAAYAGGVAGAGAGRSSEGRPMSRIVSRSVIWVPAEKSEYGLLVTDAHSQEVFPVNDKTGTIKVETSSGRLVERPAVRGELVRVEGRFAVVKLSGGRTIKTRVLGDWQVQGRTQPDEAEVA